MAACLKCGGGGDYPFRVLEVHTLHVRDLDGEKRVQALGDFQEYAVCRACAQARLDRALRPGRYLGRRLAPFLVVLAFGLAVTAVCWTGELALRLLGAAGIFCGGAGSVSVLRGAGREKRACAALPREEALRRAAWECLLETAPRKAGDNDLTYIPVNPETLKLKNGDLGIGYDLLPAVAKQAWDRLHGVEPPEKP